MWFIYLLIGIVLLFGVVVFRGAPYVPSHRNYARLALTKLYKLGKNDVLVDIGSGDGIILRLAAKQGARAIGYEINPFLVLVSKFLSRNDKRVQTRLADFWLVELPPSVTIFYVFAVSRDIEKIAAKVQGTATSVGRELWLITYGAQIGSKTPEKTLHAHALYLFKPENEALQGPKAQV